MHLHSHLRSAEEIIRQYDGSIPFASWLKNYFRQHKKFGSKDRKLVSDLCFCFYRTGKLFDSETVQNRLLLAQFLCHNDSPFIIELPPDLIAAKDLSLEGKIKASGAVNASSIFPCVDEISEAVDSTRFTISHLVQPDLFLRIRPNKANTVMQKLQAATMSFSAEEACIRLPNNSKVDEVIDFDKEAVVQDRSSQKVLDALQHQTANTKHQTFTAWDCCAASGGKSILLHDIFPKAQLTVSDIRETILHNLRNRLKRAGITNYQSFVADVSSPSFSSSKQFDVILCDAPCSGSGTWGRTPEQLHFFKKEKIDYYAALQKRIAVNAGKYVKKGGYLVYITCSVFAKENEEVVTHLLQNTSLQLVEQQYMKGYTEKADTLFSALFQL